MANVIVKLSGQHSAAVIAASLAQANQKAYLPSALRSLGEALGPFGATANVQILAGDDVKAHGVITILDYTKMTDGDTYQIGSLILTAKAAGATGAQFNIGASNTASAANLAAAVIANASLVSAKAAAAVVTITASASGVLGNAIPLIITQGTPGSASCDAALASGAADSAVTKDYRAF